MNPVTKGVFVAGDSDTNPANDVSPPDLAVLRFVQSALRALSQSFS